LEYSYIIHEQPLREVSARIRAAGPVAAYGYIEDEKEGFIKWIVVSTQISFFDF
jgi:hypothetical protein